MFSSMPLLTWLRCLLLAAATLLGGAASALTPQQARALAVGEAEERVAALNAALPNADEKTVAFIQALADDAVKFTEIAVYLIKDGKGRDPVSGVELAVPDAAEDVKIGRAHV